MGLSSPGFRLETAGATAGLSTSARSPIESPEYGCDRRTAYSACAYTSSTHTGSAEHDTSARTRIEYPGNDLVRRTAYSASAHTASAHTGSGRHDTGGPDRRGVHIKYPGSNCDRRAASARTG